MRGPDFFRFFLFTQIFDVILDGEKEEKKFFEKNKILGAGAPFFE